MVVEGVHTHTRNLAITASCCLSSHLPLGHGNGSLEKTQLKSNLKVSGGPRTDRWMDPPSRGHCPSPASSQQQRLVFSRSLPTSLKRPTNKGVYRP